MGLFSFKISLGTHSVNATATANNQAIIQIQQTETSGTAQANQQATSAAQLAATSTITKDPYYDKYNTLALNTTLIHGDRDRWNTNDACTFSSDGYHVKSMTATPKICEEGWSSTANLPLITFTFIQGEEYFVKALITMWQNVLGVSIHLDSFDLSTYLQKLYNTRNNTNGLQMWILQLTALDPDPLIWTSNFEKDAAYNNMNYGQNTSSDSLQEQTVQQLLERADVEQNPATRILLYQSAEQQLINQVAWIPLLQETKTILINPRLRGMQLNPINTIPPGAWENIYMAAQ